MEKYYMTDVKQGEHLILSSNHFVDMDTPWYELHLYSDNTYDSYQKGFKYSDRKPLSAAGLEELDFLVKEGMFTTDRDKARISITPIYIETGSEFKLL